MNIVISSEEELKDMATTLLHLSVNVQYWTDKWNEEHGYENLTAMKKWRKKMADYLKELGATKTQLKAEIKISVNPGREQKENQDETIKPD